MIVGLLATLLLGLTIWTCDVWDIILNIVAMLGSGVFCSAIVSYFIEKQQNLINLQKRLDSQRFIFSPIVTNLKTLLSKEIKYLSLCMSTEKNKSDKTVRYSLNEAIIYLNELFHSVMKNPSTFSSIFKADNMKELNAIKNKNDLLGNLLYGYTLTNYKALKQVLSSIIENGAFYLNLQILNEEMIETIKNIDDSITEIIIWSNENTVNFLIDEKIAFYKKIIPFLEIMQIHIGSIQIYV